MGTTGGSVLNAGPRTTVYTLWSGYGPVNGARTLPRGRLWLVAESAEPDARLLVRVAWNHPQTGRPVYEDVGEVISARVKLGKYVDVTVGGSKIGQTMAPCVCGAGAVGHAGPQEGRHHVQPVNPASHQRVEVV